MIVVISFKKEKHMKTNALIDMENYEHDHHPLDRKRKEKKKG
jgi:hypothetical protein